MVWLLDTSARLVVRMLGSAPQSNDAITDEEICAMLGEAAHTGVIAVDERDMIAAVMRFGDRTIRSIMTPRLNVQTIDINADLQTVVSGLGMYAHSTVLITSGGPDHIIGVVRIRDLLVDTLDAGKHNRTEPIALLRKHMRQAPAVPDTIAALKALDVLRSASVPLAIVRDEYGNFEGIVTPADILDALAGAFNSDTLPREPGARQIDDNNWMLAGAMPVDEAADLLGFNMPAQRDFQTLGGYLIHLLARIPEAGDVAETSNWRFTISSMEGRRADMIRAERITAPIEAPQQK